MSLFQVVQLRPARILFVCVGNCYRSPMAEAIANAWDREVMIAESAGLAPARCASRTAGRLMLEIGVELAPAKPRKLTAALMDQADLVVNLCEYGLPRTNTQVLKAALADPAGEALAEQRSVRNDIYAMVTRLGECLRQARQIDPVLAYSATGIQRSMTTRRSSCLNGLLT